jgi:hypothetical protein
MLSVPERRLTPRFRVTVPFLFCPMNTPLQHGHAAKSVNICTRGVYFKTTHLVFAGLLVRVVLKMPSECGSGKLATPVVFTGRVSHVEPTQTGRRSGVGVEFFYSEPLDR